MFMVKVTQKCIELLDIVDPKYILPFKTTLRYKLIQNGYNEHIEKLKSILNFINWIALITNLWTSRANEDYISVTCHFM